MSASAINTYNVYFMSEESVICFYHKHCVDGTTAAAVVLQKYPAALVFPLGFDSIEEDLAIALPTITEKSLIVYVDNAIALERVALLGNKIIVIDHHISEYEKTVTLQKKFSNVTYIFDVAESGASLTFKYFYKDTPVPTLISYVRDIDLWKKELTPKSEYAHLYLSQFRNQPDRLCEILQNTDEHYLEIGAVLVKFVEDEVLRSVTQLPVNLTVGQWQIAAYNITNHQSQAGNILSNSIKQAVLLYSISADSVRCSVRSTAGCIPTALQIATALGGGGHEHAAGAVVDRKHFFSVLT